MIDKRFLAGLVILLLIPMANASFQSLVTSVLSDYCDKNSCVDSVASFFEGYKIEMTATSVDVPNCGNSRLLNITVHVPILSKPVAVYVNDDNVCEIQGTVLGDTEKCFFFLRGAAPRTTGIEIIKINTRITSKENRNVLYSKNFLMEANHVITLEETNVENAIKSADFRISAAEVRVDERKERGVNASDAESVLNEAVAKLNESKSYFNSCDLRMALDLANGARAGADSTISLASIKSQINLSDITGMVSSAVAERIDFVLLVLLIVAFYFAHKRMSKKRKPLVRL